MATADGTWAYRDRFGDSFGRTYFRRFPPGVCSSVGIGTYLGEPTDTVDAQYVAAVETALEHGINHVDTAINYRCQRSERAVGEALRRADVDRESVVVSTKGGFLPFDGERPEDPGRYIREQFVEPGIVDPESLVQGSHSLSPGFVDAMVDRSLSNLGVDRIDCYYLHNPETQLLENDREAVYEQLKTAFELLERRRAAGEIGGYGLATWQAFRVPQGHEQYLSLPAVLDRAVAAAETVGVDNHGLQALQLPFNVEMADAFTVKSQPTDEGPVSTLEYAHESGLSVVTSASIGQGDLAAAIPPAVDAELSGDTAAQRAINFARSAPGVTTSLVGMRSVDHVAENVAAGTFDPLGATAFDTVFE
ncbi:aldo/keto reductase [Halohasta salina]|uniref:aldo/keto reductase n=1 Tax=Halohasta salina TaxID=2961621 RepID=UPI0020A5A0A5|nr:aldo/keto reductase [Halohasta salina]